MRCRSLQTAVLRLPVERVSASQMYGTRPRDGELDGAAADGGARHVYASRREGRGRRDSYGCRVPVPTSTMLRVLSALVADSQAARHVMQCFITAVQYCVLDCRRVRPALTGSAPSGDSTQPSRCLAQNFKSQHIKRWGEATNSRAVPVDEQSWRSVFLSSCYFDRLISSSGADRQASTSQPETQWLDVTLSSWHKFSHCTQTLSILSRSSGYHIADISPIDIYLHHSNFHLQICAPCILHIWVICCAPQYLRTYPARHSSRERSTSGNHITPEMSSCRKDATTCTAY